MTAAWSSARVARRGRRRARMPGRDRARARRRRHARPRGRRRASSDRTSIARSSSTDDDVGRTKVSAAAARARRRWFRAVRARAPSDPPPADERASQLVARLRRRASRAATTSRPSSSSPDACAIAKVPIVHAAAVRWHGTALAVGPSGGPCYRCLFEDVPLERRAELRGGRRGRADGRRRRRERRPTSRSRCSPARTSCGDALHLRRKVARLAAAADRPEGRAARSAATPRASRTSNPARYVEGVVPARNEARLLEGSSARRPSRIEHTKEKPWTRL